MTPDEAVDLLVSQFGDCFDRHAKMFFRQDALQYMRDVAHQAREQALDDAIDGVDNWLYDEYYAEIVKSGLRKLKVQP
jgi:hypothetical protein